MIFILCILTFLTASACILLVAFAGWLIKLMLEDIMVKKEITIDGVNVNECKYFCKFTTICRNENIGCVVCPRCKNVVDCYFKQLKRTEQKLEKIKDIATDLLPLTNEYDNCYYKDNCNKCDKECQYKFVDKMLQIIEGK